MDLLDLNLLLGQVGRDLGESTALSEGRADTQGPHQCFQNHSGPAGLWVGRGERAEGGFPREPNLA